MLLLNDHMYLNLVICSIFTIPLIFQERLWFLARFTFSSIAITHSELHRYSLLARLGVRTVFHKK